MTYDVIKIEFASIGGLIDSGDLRQAMLRYETLMRCGATRHDRDHLLGRSRVTKLVRFAKKYMTENA